MIDRPLESSAPTLVKANLQEISGELGALGSEPLQIANSLQNRSDLPAQTIVTLGEAGAILVTARQSWYAKPPRISHVNPIGAGDAFAAGYIRAYVEGSSPETALQFATAVAASDAATVEPGWINFSEVTSLVSETQVYCLTTVSKT